MITKFTIFVICFVFLNISNSTSTTIYQKLWYVGYTDSVGKYLPYSTIKTAYSNILPQFISSISECDGLGDESVYFYRELNVQSNTVTLEYKYFPSGGIEKYKNFLYYVIDSKGLNYTDKNLYFIAYDIEHETLFTQVDNVNIKQGILSTFKILYFDCKEDAINYLDFLKNANNDLKYVFYDPEENSHLLNQNSLTNEEDIKAIKLLQNELEIK